MIVAVDRAVIGATRMPTKAPKASLKVSVTLADRLVLSPLTVTCTESGRSGGDGAFSLTMRATMLATASEFDGESFRVLPPARTAAIMLVVVVLPCMPATAMPYLRRMSSASISARWMTGILR